MDRRPFLALLAAGASARLLAVPAEALWASLAAGGQVLLMRHAATDPGIGDPPGFVLAECGTQRNLSEHGRRDARLIGQAFRSRRIPVGAVLSSRWCRCLETARLAFGRAEPAPMLDSMFRDEEARRREKRAQVLARAGSHAGQANLVLVTHEVNVRALVDAYLAQGEIAVARPAGGRLALLGVLRAHR